jgi:hypothetical protein
VGFSIYQGSALALFASGVVTLGYRWWLDRWARQVARRAFDARRALYTEVPVRRALGDDELLEERSLLDAVTDALPALRRVADYVDVYAEGSPFRQDRSPIRILAGGDDDTVVAQVFVTPGGVVRIHLATELDGGQWVLTENNANEIRVQRPEGFTVTRLRRDVLPAALLAKHEEVVRDRRGEAAAPRSVRSFDDFVASYDRRWTAIREHRRAIGWILPEEVVFAAGTQREDKERVLREVERLRERQ